MMTLADEADLAPVRGRRVAIIGYGNHGRSHALNLRDSGVRELRIALRPGSPSADKARADGFEVSSLSEAAAWADLVSLLAADEAHGEIWREAIAPNRPEGQALMVCHGFSMQYGLIDPPPDADVVLAAAKGPGGAVRSEFLKGRGLIGYWAVRQDASGGAEALAVSYLHAIGCGNAGIFETTFEEEAVSDLLGEQAVLVGGMVALARAGYEALVGAGVSPRMAYIDTVHELKYIADLIHERGVEGMYRAISGTAEYGARACAPKIADAHMTAVFGNLLDDIRSGGFASAWVAEYEAGAPRLKAWREAGASDPLEAVGTELRARLQGDLGGERV